VSDVATTGPGRVDFSAIADQLVSQPSLFDAATLPVEMDTVRAARIFAFSGTTTCNSRHETRAMTIAALRLAGVSKREVARQLSCSRNTIDAVMDVLEERGKIEPLKEKLPRLLSAAAAEAAEWARELIDERAVSTEVAATLKALGVLAGIGADKVVAAAAQVAGDLHLHQHVHLEGSDPTRDYLRQRAAALATDSHAAGDGHKQLSANASPIDAASLAAAAPPPIEVQVVAEDRAPGPEVDAADPAGTGGRGGRDRAGAPSIPMASPSDSF
jgi:transposase-like protein